MSWTITLEYQRLPRERGKGWGCSARLVIESDRLIPADTVTPAPKWAFTYTFESSHAFRDSVCKNEIQSEWKDILGGVAKGWSNSSVISLELSLYVDPVHSHARTWYTRSREDRETIIHGLEGIPAAACESLAAWLPQLEAWEESCLPAEGDAEPTRVVATIGEPTPAATAVVAPRKRRRIALVQQEVAA